MELLGEFTVLQLLLIIPAVVPWQWCYVCSGIGQDQATCEKAPHTVVDGPGVINCTASHCTTVKVSYSSGETHSFARLCEETDRGNWCLHDSVFTTCYLTCQDDFCNHHVPDPASLPDGGYLTPHTGSHDHRKSPHTGSSHRHGDTEWGGSRETVEREEPPNSILVFGGLHTPKVVPKYGLGQSQGLSQRQGQGYRRSQGQGQGYLWGKGHGRKVSFGRNPRVDLRNVVKGPGYRHVSDVTNHGKHGNHTSEVLRSSHKATAAAQSDPQKPGQGHNAAPPGRSLLVVSCLVLLVTLLLV